MSRDLPHIPGHAVEGCQHATQDPTEYIAPFVGDDGAGGRVTYIHADFALIGELARNGASRIMMQTGTRGCPCGCGAPGRGVIKTMSPEVARATAAILISLAEAHEAAAATAAADALARAKGLAK